MKRSIIGWDKKWWTINLQRKILLYFPKDPKLMKPNKRNPIFIEAEGGFYLNELVPDIDYNGYRSGQDHCLLLYHFQRTLYIKFEKAQSLLQFYNALHVRPRDVKFLKPKAQFLSNSQSLEILSEKSADHRQAVMFQKQMSLMPRGGRPRNGSVPIRSRSTALNKPLTMTDAMGNSNPINGIPRAYTEHNGVSNGANGHHHDSNGNNNRVSRLRFKTAEAFYTETKVESHDAIRGFRANSNMATNGINDDDDDGTPPPPETYRPENHLGDGMMDEPAMGIGTAILNHEMLMDSQKMDIDDFNFDEFNESDEFRESVEFNDFNNEYNGSDPRLRGNSSTSMVHNSSGIAMGPMSMGMNSPTTIRIGGVGNQMTFPPKKPPKKGVRGSRGSRGTRGSRGSKSSKSDKTRKSVTIKYEKKEHSMTDSDLNRMDLMEDDRHSFGNRKGFKGRHEQQASNLDLFRDSMGDIAVDGNLSDDEDDGGIAFTMRGDDELLLTDDEHQRGKKRNSSLSGAFSMRKKTNESFMRSPVEDSINDEFGMFEYSRTSQYQMHVQRMISKSNGNSRRGSNSGDYGRSALASFQKNSVVGINGLNGPNGIGKMDEAKEDEEEVESENGNMSRHHHPVVPSPEMKPVVVTRRSTERSTPSPSPRMYVLFLFVASC